MSYKIISKLFYFNFDNNKIVLYLHSQYSNVFDAHWRNGRAVECGSLENC
jgi:hypothetical protein